MEISPANQLTWCAWKYHSVDHTLCNKLPSAADKSNSALDATHSCSLLLVLHYTVLVAVSCDCMFDSAAAHIISAQHKDCCQQKWMVWYCHPATCTAGLPSSLCTHLAQPTPRTWMAMCIHAPASSLTPGSWPGSVWRAWELEKLQWFSAGTNSPDGAQHSTAQHSTAQHSTAQQPHNSCGEHLMGVTVASLLVCML